MTARQFRSLALSLPRASEAAHMGHPDFRVAGRIFGRPFPVVGRGSLDGGGDITTER